MVSHMRDRMTQRNTWSDYLSEAIYSRRWSVARLAREARVGRSTIHRWLSGQVTNITTEKVRAVAEALGDDPATALRAAGMSGPSQQEAPGTAPTPAQLREQLVSSTRLPDGLIDRLVDYYTGVYDEQHREPPHASGG
jgi:transcriptional regulator with XRE-family HTH domain